MRRERMISMDSKLASDEFGHMGCPETDINIHGPICGRPFSGQSTENKTGTKVDGVEEENRRLPLR
jgi:hypothetical protein